MHVYRLNNVAVEWVDTFKYLGVRILLYPLQLRPSLHRRDQTETGDEEHRDACEIVSFPDRIFRARWKNGSGQLPIPFSFKCAGMLAHCSFLIGIRFFHFAQT